MTFIAEAKYLSLFVEIFSLENNADGAAHAKDIMSQLKALVQDSKLDITRAYTDMPEGRERLENSVKSTYPKELNMGTPETRKKHLQVIHSFMSMVHRKKRKAYLNRCYKQRLKATKNAIAIGAIVKESNSSASYSSVRKNRAYTGRRQLYVSVPPLQTKRPTKSSAESGEPVNTLIDNKRTKSFNEVLDSPTTAVVNSKARLCRTEFRRTPYPSGSLADRNHEQIYTPSPASNINAFMGNTYLSVPVPAAVPSPTSGPYSTTRDITAASPRSTLGLTPSTPYNFQISSANHTEHSVPRTNLDEMTELRHFLSTCEPSLLKFLPQFVAVGCRNKQYLRAVSKLPEPVLKEFIESLVNNDEERRMTVTEKFILRAWFGKYFNSV